MRLRIMRIPASSATSQRPFTTTSLALVPMMMMMMRLRLLFWFLLVTIVTSAGRSRVRLNSQSTSRSIQLLNQAGVKVDFFWVNSATGKLADSNTPGGEGIAGGGDAASNSFVGHTFEVQELPNKHTNRCRREKCSTTRFTVSQNEDQIFTLHKNFTVTVEDHKTRARATAKKALNACQVADVNASSSNSSSASSSVSSSTPEEKLAVMMECMERQIDAAISKTRQEIQFQASIRKDMGASLVSYICNDYKANTSKAVLNHTWTFANPSNPTGKKEQKHVRILFEAEFSKILLIEDFMSRHECEAIRNGSHPITLDENNDNEQEALDDNEEIMVLPLSAKADNMDVVKVLLKVQSLVDTMLGRKVNFSDKDPLFEIHRYHSVVGNKDEEINETCTASSSGEEGTCEAVKTVSSMDDRNIHWIYHEDEEEEQVIFATLLVICQANRGAIHFPKTGVHVAATNETVGHAVLVVHRDAATMEQDDDPYLNEYAICTPTSSSGISKDDDKDIPKSKEPSMTLLVDRFAG